MKIAQRLLAVAKFEDLTKRLRDQATAGATIDEWEGNSGSVACNSPSASGIPSIYRASDFYCGAMNILTVHGLSYIASMTIPITPMQQAESLLREIMKKEASILRIKEEIASLRAELARLFEGIQSQPKEVAAIPPTQPTTTLSRNTGAHPPSGGLFAGLDEYDKNKTLKQRALELINGSERQWTTQELLGALDSDNKQTMASTVSRLYKAGLISKPDARHWAKKKEGSG